MASIEDDVAAVLALPSTARILSAVCALTGLRFAAIARVTDERWVSCATVDRLEFGLKPGDELVLETTFCHEVRGCGRTIVMDDASTDPVYRDHGIPKQYGFRSYISVPIVERDGKFFGTLCGLDPEPRALDVPSVLETFELFAELIAEQLDTYRESLRNARDLENERLLGHLREEFLAVLGHDLRNPVASILAGVNVLKRGNLDSAKAATLVEQMGASASRMDGLINNLLDLARARLGGGLSIEFDREAELRGEFEQVVAEMRSTCPNEIRCEFDFGRFACDPARLGQVLSNLLSNAVTHGAPGEPILVRAVDREGNFVLSVLNAGEPMPTRVQQSLFKPFYRGDAAPSQGGLGLGLYIASEIAKAHGGEIAVRTGEGTVELVVTIPLPSAVS
jgi:signal transduction histidine kinase